MEIPVSFQPIFYSIGMWKDISISAQKEVSFESEVQRPTNMVSL